MSVQIVVSLSNIDSIFVLVVSMLSTLFRIGTNIVSESTRCSEVVQRSKLKYFLLCSGDLEITVEFITEIDKLVQLIESPIFACKFSSVKKKKILPEK